MPQIIVTVNKDVDLQTLMEAAKTVPGVTGVALVTDAEAARMAAIRGLLDALFQGRV